MCQEKFAFNKLVNRSTRLFLQQQVKCIIDLAKFYKTAEERRLEYRFLNMGVHVNIRDNVDDIDVINIDGECDGGRGKIKATTNASSSYDRKPKKWKKMKNYLDVCKSAEATSSAKEKYSIEECMEVVEEMGDIEHNAFMKMMDKIITLEWRKIFLKMSEARRRA